MRKSKKAKLMLLGLVGFNGLIWSLFAVNFYNVPGLLAIGGMAYLFGLRHAFDADHIAAIDNVTRKLVQDQKDASSVGFFFSFGHSSVVIGLSLALVFATKAVKESIPTLQSVGNVVGTLISAFFLILIGVLNIFIFKALYDIYKMYKESSSEYQEELNKTFQELLNKRGFMGRVFSFLYNKIDTPYKMYIVGFLFGLGFDTATEIAILGISVALAKTNMNIWGILLFPLLFTAGMTLMDSFDSLIMNNIYFWTNNDPLRRLSFNLVITGASVFIALFIGTLELLQILTQELMPKAYFTAFINGIPLGKVGIFIVLFMIFTFLGAFIFYGKASKQNIYHTENIN
ncbi:HoxN/HupN/NixA family nickel/cobalt transporter [Hydrogenobaculum acidophilum]